MSSSTNPPQPLSPEKPVALISQRRFGPFFWTQALGAFNDNVYKQALLILIAYQGLVWFGLDSARLVNLAAAVFVLPFFAFSALAGQLAEVAEKSQLIRRIKLAEIAIMAMGSVALATSSVPLLIAVLFFMGAQSTFFAPVKYSILPQVLVEGELLRGNGQIAMATFVAILIGSMLGGVLIALNGGWLWVSIAVLFVASLGYLISRAIPPVPVAAPGLRIDWNLVRQSWQIIQHARANPVVFRSILGVSWFWFFGSILLAQLPPLVQGVLRGSEGVAVAAFTGFSVGVGVGALACDKLSWRKIEIGLVPLGSIGLTLFGLDFCWTARQLSGASELRSLAEFVAQPGALRLFGDIVAMGASGGLFIVPLNALIQHRTPNDRRSRVIAGGNLLNAVAMVLAGVVAVGLLSAGLTVLQLVLVAALMNAVVAAYIYWLVPEFLLRFAAWALVSTAYRLRIRDLERIPETGGALLVCNHVSFVDALVIGGSVRRPVRFVMYYKLFRWPVFRHFYQAARAIPIASAREDPELLEQALDRIAAELAAGELVCIFPEGALSRDGQVAEFRRGVEAIVARTPVPVVPMALTGLWGSFFSHAGGAFRGAFKRVLSRIELRVGAPIAPQDVTADRLRARVLDLLEEGA